MDDRAVVTVFLTHAGEVLLLHRSEAVGSYAGRWGAVAGHVEGTPLESAHEEIREETGIDSGAVSLIREGEPVTVTDPERGIRWTVHPFRFGTTTRDISPNWETTEIDWVAPPEIRERETVPALWTAWDRVRPTVESVAGDTDSGSATISRRALAVLRDEAAILADDGGEWAAIAQIARELRAARDAMAVVRVRIDRAMNAASAARTPAAVRDAAIAGLDRAFDADREAATRAAEEIEGQTVFTLSRSGTVERALDIAPLESVHVAVSRPGAEGRDLAALLADRGEDVTLYGDMSVPGAVTDSDSVLVGADTIVANGDVINKAGTTVAALAASWADVPMIVVAASAKISPEPDAERSDAGAERQANGVSGPGVAQADTDSAPSVRQVDPHFERTPAAFIDAYITEEGTLTAAQIRAVAARHADLAGWMDNR